MTLPENETEFNAIHEIWFKLSIEDRFKFLEENIQIQNTKGKIIPLTMTHFQRKWFLDGPLFKDFSTLNSFRNRICLKCRNVGASYVLIAVEATLACWLYPNIFIPFVASQEDQANAIIKHCKKVIRNAKFSIPLEVALENQTLSSIKFANGASMQAFAGGNPDGIRGPRALISYVDEFAFVGKQQEVMSAVEFFHAEGGQMNILSTPWGKQTLFWRIWSDRDNYVAWDRHLVSLFTTMAGFDVSVPLQKQIIERGFQLSAPWLDIDFLEKKRQQDAPFNYANFLQEVCGVPMEEVTAAITEDILDTNAMDYYQVDARPILPDGMMDPEPIYIMSADFGAEKNMTAVDVEEARDGRLITCYTERFRGSFPEQLSRMKALVRRFMPQIFIGDATGMGGQNWMSQLQEDIKEGVVLGINYSRKDFAEQANLDMNNKNFMVLTAIRYMSEGLVVTPKNHRQLRDELLGLKKIVYDKTVKYTGKDGPAGADDLAFAKLQAAMLYDRIYSVHEGDYASSADADITSKGKRTYFNRPQIMKAQASVEAAGGPKKTLERNKEPAIEGFSKLI